MSADKAADPLKSFDEFVAAKGVLPRAQPTRAVGLMGWVSAAVPRARPYASHLWSALASSDHEHGSAARCGFDQKRWLFKRRVSFAMRWLQALGQEPRALQEHIIRGDAVHHRSSHNCFKRLPVRVWSGALQCAGDANCLLGRWLGDLGSCTVQRPSRRSCMAGGAGASRSALLAHRFFARS